MLAALLAVVLVLAVVWAVKLALVVRSVDQRADHWAQPRGAMGGLLYVALGDSAAQGIGASSPSVATSGCSPTGSAPAPTGPSRW